MSSVWNTFADPPEIVTVDQPPPPPPEMETIYVILRRDDWLMSYYLDGVLIANKTVSYWSQPPSGTVQDPRFLAPGFSTGIPYNFAWAADPTNYLDGVQIWGGLNWPWWIKNFHFDGVLINDLQTTPTLNGTTIAGTQWIIQSYPTGGNALHFGYAAGGGTATFKYLGLAVGGLNTLHHFECDISTYQLGQDNWTFALAWTGRQQTQAWNPWQGVIPIATSYDPRNGATPFIGWSGSGRTTWDISGTGFSSFTVNPDSTGPAWTTILPNTSTTWHTFRGEATWLGSTIGPATPWGFEFAAS